MAGSSWRLAGVWPWWVLLAAEAAALIVCITAYHLSYRRLQPGRRALLLGLRFLWVQAIVLAAMNPVIESVQSIRDVPSLIMMVDTSASMAEKDERGRSRLEAAKEALRVSWPEVQAASARFTPVLASFDEEVEPLGEPGDIGEAAGTASRLDRALRWTVERAGLPSLGVVLFTDGAANSYVRVLEEVERVKSMRLPVYPVMLGAAQPGPEIWIEDVEMREKMYVRRDEPITVKIIHSMPAPGTITTHLAITEDGVRRVDSGPVTVYGIGGSTDVPVHYKPLAPGYHWLEFSLTPFPGERRRDNNYAVRVIKVVAQDISLLAISRGFSYDMGLVTRHVRSIGDAAVQTYSVPFQDPRFEDARDLEAVYDVVVVEAKALSALKAPYRTAVGEFVRDGGGLVLVAGPDWGSSRPDKDALYDVFQQSVYAEKERSEAGWLVRPGENGGEIQRLSLRPAENRNIWAGLGPLHYRYAVELSFIRDRGEPLVFSDGVPFVVTGTFGRGRVAIVLGGPLFRWGLSQRRTRPHFARFIQGLVKYVNPGERQTRPLRVQPEKLLYKEGEEVRLRASSDRARQARLGIYSQKIKDGPPVRRDTVSLEEGTTDVSLGDDLAPGSYTVVLKDGDEASETGFVVNAVDEEAGRIEPELGLLDHIASETRGRSVRGAKGAVELMESLVSQPPPPLRYIRRERPLLPFYVYLAAFLFAAAGEWYLRRRWGLV